MSKPIWTTEDFGEALKEARIRKEMTQEELSAYSGIDQGSISRYERGKRFPSMPVLICLITALGYQLSVEAISE